MLDFIANGLLIVGPTVFGLGLAIWGFTDGNKTVALWVGTFGIILLCVGFAMQLQSQISKKTAPPSPSLSEISANRAYVGFGDLTAVLLNSPADGQVTAWIRITNTGKTPAIKSKGWLLFKLDLNNNLPFAETRNFDNEATMAPGYDANLYSTQPITTAQLRAVENGQISFFVWGRIEYEDIYGHPHFHDFQGRMNGPKETIITGGRVAQGWGFKPFGNGTRSD